MCDINGTHPFARNKTIISGIMAIAENGTEKHFLRDELLPSMSSMRD